jgi:Raf kinase inhibitor-like YbhB/YbcL family protein
MPLMLVSPAIPPGSEIAAQYTCDGADISPPLTWSGLPDGTKSLILHWAVFDISAASSGLEAGYSATRPATGFREARNDFGKMGYDGPCPPRGHGAHHYHFRLFAISRPTLDLRAPATALDVLKAAEPYAIQQAELIGTYHR